MKKAQAAGIALAITLACSTSIKQAGAESYTLKNGSIVRKPTQADYLAEWQKQKTLEELLTFNHMDSIDVRSADLSDADLSIIPGILTSTFDSRTTWSNLLPPGFDPDKLMELGKDPGLGLRSLHEQGITGKGVGIAIIDQTLLVDHEEYADRLMYYAEYNSMALDAASPHGAGVSSIALGKTTGVAPEALLYFIADDVGTETPDGEFIRDLTFYAQDIDRMIDLNEQLPSDERIRIISMSIGWQRNDKGVKEIETAIQRARVAGIEVVWVSDNDPLASQFVGMGREPLANANDIASCRPGLFWEKNLFSGEFTGAEKILLPMDNRCIASPTGTSDYAFYSTGGSSWKVPYVAGLYALACQVKPDITFEAFLSAAKATGRPVSIEHEGVEYPYGLVADPAKIIEYIRAE